MPSEIPLSRVKSVDTRESTDFWKGQLSEHVEVLNEKKKAIKKQVDYDLDAIHRVMEKRVLEASDPHRGLDDSGSQLEEEVCTAAWAVRLAWAARLACGYHRGRPPGQEEEESLDLPGRGPSHPPCWAPPVRAAEHRG